MQHVSYHVLTRPQGQLLFPFSSQVFPYVKLKLILFLFVLLCFALSQFPLLQTSVERENYFLTLPRHTHCREGVGPALTTSLSYLGLQHLLTEMC